MGLIADVQGARGLHFNEPKIILVKNRSGGSRALGELLQFDIRLTIATNYRSGNEDSAWFNVITPTLAALNDYAPLVVCAEPIADGQVGRAYVRGPGVPLIVNGAAVAGERWGSLAGTNQADITPAIGTQVYGITTEVSSGVGDLVTTIFDGFYGIGNG